MVYCSAGKRKYNFFLDRIKNANKLSYTDGRKEKVLPGLPTSGDDICFFFNFTPPLNRSLNYENESYIFYFC